MALRGHPTYEVGTGVATESHPYNQVRRQLKQCPSGDRISTNHAQQEIESMSAPNESFQAPSPPTPETKPRTRRPVKLRPFAIAFFVLGLLVLGAGIPGIVPGGISLGIVIAIFGILLFAFSFIPLPVIPDA